MRRAMERVIGRERHVCSSIPDSSEKAYFLKVGAGDRGRGMMKGEYESMKVLYSVTPHFCPKPLTHGTFKSLHLFLCDFR
jgi:protein-ribulosamine 3-kinase